MGATLFSDTQNVEKKIPENCRGPHFQTNPNIMIYMLMHYAYAVPEGVSYTGREREIYIYIYCDCDIFIKFIGWHIVI